MIDWNKVRDFVHKRTLFCSAAVVEEQGIRMFPIGSLRVGRDGSATYFELFARPVEEGAPITFMAVDVGLWFWLSSLLKGRFDRPPAVRLMGRVGRKRPCSEEEARGWHRRVGLLLKTPGGKALWSKPGPIREIVFERAEPVKVGKVTHHLKDWAHIRSRF